MDTTQMFIGIDIGGSSVKYGVGNSKHGLQSFHRVALKNKSLLGLKQVVGDIIADLQESSQWTEIAAIGIGTPGLIDKKTGRLFGVNPNLPFWTDLDPASVLPPDLVHPAFSDNDANLMALAEASRFPDTYSVLGVTIGSGIGSGFVQNTRIMHGSNGFAMELGHVCMVPNGAQCNCGKHGCLETYAALNGMRLRAQERGRDLANVQLADILHQSHSDEVVHAVVAEGVLYLAVAVANAIILLDPDVVVFGGGASEIADYPLQHLYTEIHSHLSASTRDKISLERAHIGNQSGVYGAILLAELLFNEV